MSPTYTQPGGSVMSKGFQRLGQPRSIQHPQLVSGTIYIHTNKSTLLCLAKTRSPTYPTIRSTKTTIITSLPGYGGGTGTCMYVNAKKKTRHIVQTPTRYSLHFSKTRQHRHNCCQKYRQSSCFRYHLLISSSPAGM